MHQIGLFFNILVEIKITPENNLDRIVPPSPNDDNYNIDINDNIKLDNNVCLYVNHIR